MWEVAKENSVIGNIIDLMETGGILFKKR